MVKVEPGNGSQTGTLLGRVNSEILLLFTVLQQGQAFQKSHPFEYLFGIVFDPKVTQKGYLHGSSKIAPKKGRF